MTTNITIRRGTSDDIPSILKIIRKVVPIMNSKNNFQWTPAVYPLEDDFRKDVEQNCCYVAVDTITSDIVGVAALTEDQPPEYGDACDIADKAIVPHRVAVDPDYQGKGIAKLLFNHADVLAKQREYKYVRVDTNTMNLAMQNLFVKCGFILKGEISLAGKHSGMRFLCYEKAL